MRYIDPVLKARLLLMQQTLYNNAQPSMDVHAIRPRTPIFHKRFWEESVVAASMAAQSTSVAIRKMGTTADRAYVAYVSNGILRVKSAAITVPVSNMIWQIELTIPNCLACVLEFDGHFIRASYNKVEYRTDLLPWLFYVTDNGQLLGGILGGDFAVLVGANVTTLDVVRGIASEYKDIDQGLLLFYTYGGSVYYNSLISGIWQGQQTVDIGPTNAVSLKCERLFDYRIVLQITDASGALWEVFSKMYASGWNGNEKLTTALGMSLAVTKITYIDRKADERVTAGLGMNLVDLYALAPKMLQAYNLDDGLGNYGFLVNVLWDEDIFDTAEAATHFTITDNFGGAWSGQSITQSDRCLTITFMDFNNAINPCHLQYSTGVIRGDIELSETQSIDFTALGLIPTQPPEPLCVAAENLDAKTIVLTFDMPVLSSNLGSNTAAISVTASEYNRIPDGELIVVSYVDSAVAYYAAQHNETAVFSEAALTDTSITSGSIELAEA